MEGGQRRVLEVVEGFHLEGVVFALLLERLFGVLLSNLHILFIFFVVLGPF